VVTYKKVKEEDRDKFQDMIHYAFSPHREEVDHHKDEDYWSMIGDPRGIYDGDKLLAVSSIHYLESRLRGEWLTMGGIGAVATAPENRHKGYTKVMFTELLRELREKNVILSSLWPFSYPFYDKLGWRSCDKYTTYELVPEVLKFAAKNPDGKFRQVFRDDHGDIVSTYRKFVRKFNLPLRRSSDWWKYNRFRQWDKTVYCYLWEKNTDVNGYVIYSIEKGLQGEQKKKLNVDELVYETEEAFFQLLRFLYNHGSQMSRITLPSPLPEGLSMLDLVDDPRALETREKPGIMFRCVDVKAALEALPFPERVEDKIIISIEDPLLKKNSEQFCLNFDGASPPAISRINQQGPKPDISMDVGSLTQLYVGYLNPSQAVTAGNITLENEDKLPALNKIFPGKRTLFYDGF